MFLCCDIQHLPVFKSHFLWWWLSKKHASMPSGEKGGFSKLWHKFWVEEFQRKHWLLTSSKYVRLCLGYGTQHITKVDKNLLKVTVKVYRCQLLTRFINCNYKVLLHFWSVIFIGWILDTRQFTTRAPWTTWEGWTAGNILDCSLNK